MDVVEKDVVETRVSDILSHRWSLVLLRGLCAIAFGILAWTRPGIALTTLVLIFGTYALVDGILEVATALEDRSHRESWWLLLLAGLVGIGVGLLAFSRPGATAAALLFYLAVWAVARGVLEIVLAIRIRREITGEWRLIFAGILSVLFGAMLMARPAAGVRAVLWLVGLYAVWFGILLVMLAFKARSVGARLSRGAATPA
jgi:uncharacterized membrane protein HdeD (DUF308 family)